MFAQARGTTYERPYGRFAWSTLCIGVVYLQVWEAILAINLFLPLMQVCEVHAPGRAVKVSPHLRFAQLEMDSHDRASLPWSPTLRNVS